MIYADHAATTMLDEEALAAMEPYLRGDYGNVSQPYSFARTAKKGLRDARETIATAIGAKPEEIFFTSGGTESDNWAIKGTTFSGEKNAMIITSAFEHFAVLRSCEALEKFGCSVVRLVPTKAGFITPAALAEVIPATPTLVSIMMANNEIGTVQPIRDLCAVAHRQGALFHTDAVQALGHIPVNVEELGVDLLSASAHKFNGPKGVGFLYIRKGTPVSPYAHGGSQEAGLRAGTENVASIVGMAVALQKNTADMAAVQAHLQRLEQILLSALSASGVPFRRNGAAPQVPGSLSLSFRGREGEALLHRLDLLGIMVSTGSACDSQSTQISHVLQAIGAEEDYAMGTIRISLGRDNTEEEAATIADALLKILADF